MNKKRNNINPNHYGAGRKHECIDVMEQQFGVDAVLNFCCLNAFKYLYRCKKKDNDVENMQKARWYINKYISLAKELKYSDTIRANTEKLKGVCDELRSVKSMINQTTSKMKDIKFIEEYVANLKEVGIELVRLTDVPNEILVELATSRKDANLNKKLLKHVEQIYKHLERILIEMPYDVVSIRKSISDALKYMDVWEWQSGHVLIEAKKLNHSNTMYEIACSCLKSELAKIELCIDFLKGLFEIPEAEVAPIIERAVEKLLAESDENLGVFDVNTLRVAFFERN